MSTCFSAARGLRDIFSIQYSVFAVNASDVCTPLRKRNLSTGQDSSSTINEKKQGYMKTKLRFAEGNEKSGSHYAEVR